MSSFFSRSSKPESSTTHTGKEAGPETSEIFTSPPEGVIPKKKWTYNEEQLAKIEALWEYSNTLLLPEDDPYYPWEKRFLADPGCHPRYMRAAKWRLPEGKTRIKGTIEWRRQFKPELISPKEVGIEAETGKIILTGFDLDARPILYMRPGRENTQTSPRQIQHLIYHLERAIDFMPPGQEQVAIIVDYKSATSQSNPSISTARKVLNILQNHYVERLGRGLVVNMPWWINAFFSGISPFLDPVTRDKIRFNPKLHELVPDAQLDLEFGGEYHFKYDYPIYWKTMNDFCHLVDDGGTRVDPEGKKWYPPLGNGIKAAVEGLVPVKGATQTGEAVQVSGEEGKKEADPDARSNLPNGILSGQTDVPEPSQNSLYLANGTGTNAERASGVGVAAAEPVPAGDDAATAGAVAGGAVATTQSKDEPTAAQKLATQTRAETAKEEKTEETGGLAGQVENMRLENGGTGTPEPPAVGTKPGEPAGDLKFDHEPSKKEVKEALKAAA